MDRLKHDKRMWMLVITLIYLLAISFFGYHLMEPNINAYLDPKYILSSAKFWLKLDKFYTYVIMIALFLFVLLMRFMAKEAISISNKITFQIFCNTLGINDYLLLLFDNVIYIIFISNHGLDRIYEINSSH